MTQSASGIFETSTTATPWSTPIRMLHWLTAASMAGATILTSQGDTGHTTLGYILLGTLLFQLIGLPRNRFPSPTLWLLVTLVITLDVSNWLAPFSALHWGVTLATLVPATIYCAVVLVESLQRVPVRAIRPC